MHRPPLGLLLAASATLAACAPDATLRPEAAEPADVALSVDAAAPLASLGDTALVRLRVVDRDGRAMEGLPLRWSLSPAGVLRQEAPGVYRAVGNGRATVVAELDPGATGVQPGGYWAGRIADSVVVEVRQRAARLTLAPVDTAFATLGALRPMRVQVTDARGHALLDGPPPLTWASTDAGVLSVDGAGVVRSIGEGTARITVQAAGLAGAATFTVSPRLPHTSCMVFAQRRQTRQACVTLDLVVREREGGR
jgi:hypothetical protein